MSEAGDTRRLTSRGYSREDAAVWREEPPVEDSAPDGRPASIARLEDWGVTRDQAAAMLRDRMCPVCGSGPWGSVLTHVSKGHGIDRYTTRELCGLNTTEVLASPEVSERRSALSKAASEARDMTELAARPRKKYRYTTAGRAAVTANLETEQAELGRRSEQGRANLANSVRASWATLTDEEKSARLANMHRARRADG